MLYTIGFLRSAPAGGVSAFFFLQMTIKDEAAGFAAAFFYSTDFKELFLVLSISLVQRPLKRHSGIGDAIANIGRVGLKNRYER